MLYFDTNALLPYYRQSPQSSDVQALLASQSEPVLISQLTRAEIAAALGRWVRSSDLDEHMANRIEAAMRQGQNAGRFRTPALGAQEYERAYEWLNGHRTSHRALDALHLACAQTAGATLVSLDDALLRAVDYLPVPVHRLASLPLATLRNSETAGPHARGAAARFSFQGEAHPAHIAFRLLGVACAGGSEPNPERAAREASSRR